MSQQEYLMTGESMYHNFTAHKPIGDYKPTVEASLLTPAQKVQQERLKEQAYHHELATSLNSIIGTCQAIGSGSDDASNNAVGTTGPIDQVGLTKAHKVPGMQTLGASHESLNYSIHHDPIFLAFAKVMGAMYQNFAWIMKLNSEAKKQIGKISTQLQKLMDILNQILNVGEKPDPSKDPQGYQKWLQKVEKLTQKIANALKKFKNLLNNKHVIKALGGKKSSLYKELKKIPSDFNNELSKSTGGKVANFNDLVKMFQDPSTRDQAASYFDDFRKEMQDESGKTPGKTVTGLFSDISNATSAVNSQSAAKSEKINQATQNIQADAKLNAAATQMYRSMIPGLTTYSGS